MNTDITITSKKLPIQELNQTLVKDAAICFHCGEPLPQTGSDFITINGRLEPMCCSGCKAVAQFIVDAGLDSYYSHRKELPGKITDTSLLDVRDWQAFDEVVTIQKSGQDMSEVLLDIEGMHCVSCAWLVQQKLESGNDVKVVSLDHQSGIALIRWNKSKLALSSILYTINALGYLPHLLEQDESGDLEYDLGVRRSEDSLKRLVVAGLGMMQVMMFAVALYSGDEMNMQSVYRRFLVWVSMLVTFPVLFYSGMPFLRHAWHSIKMRRMHMDIPITIALLSAFSLSVVNSFLATGEVYFDSVVMFVFFLSVSRYIQESITRRMISSRQAFSRMLPVLAEVDINGRCVKKPATEIRTGDKISIPIGGIIPADGEILSGRTEIDAAWISGESMPLQFAQGDKVFAGMVNLSNPIQITVSKDARQSALSVLSRRLQRSEYISSEQKTFVTRYVTGFIAFTLLLALCAFAYWYFQNEWRYGFEIALAVLVVSCPCALAIAMPSSVASLTKSLHDCGIYIINPDKLLNLTRVSTVILDKTGTLTDPLPELVAPSIQDNTDKYLDYACALSHFTQHPKARFLHASKSDTNVTGVEEKKGLGISGLINGQRYYLGQPGYVSDLEQTGVELLESYLCFGDGRSCLLKWAVEDVPRSGADSMLKLIQAQDCKTILCSGDQETRVSLIADEFNFDHYYARQSSEQKLEIIQALQQQGEVVLSIGDGVNDAEFLQQADLSVSFTSATDLAQANADILIANQDLSKIEVLMHSAENLKRIYRQNLAWAISYNVVMLPLAVLGYIQPWIAALGMSLSSLFVVANSLRLSRSSQPSIKTIPAEACKA